MEYKNGKAGSGTKIHVVSVFTRPSDGLVIESILCGSQQFNGTGKGSLNRTSTYNPDTVNCKKCIKQLLEKRV